MRKYKDGSRTWKFTATLNVIVQADEEFMLDQVVQDIAKAAIQLGAIRVDQTTTTTVAEK